MMRKPKSSSAFGEFGAVPRLSGLLSQNLSQQLKGFCLNLRHEKNHANCLKYHQNCKRLKTFDNES
jgi:hypothetical protein